MQHDCLAGCKCYRCRVAITPLASNRLCFAVFLALALAGGGRLDAAADTGSPATVEPVSSVASVPFEDAWWRKTGDPILTDLIEHGLSADRDATCRLAALRERDRAAAANTVGAALKRLFAQDTSARNLASRQIAVGRLADGRVRLARDIALAYIELRRLQRLHTLRAGVVDQYKDNAQIAEFRRQAGLVSAIDGALAAEQDGTARAELGYVDGRLRDALARLAELAGIEPTLLAGRVGEGAPLPPALLDAPDAQVDNGRENTLSAALDAASRAVKDARSAYREGAGNFPTLYVAEVAALSVEQALADARAQRASATIRLWSGREQGWARADADSPTTIVATPKTPTETGKAADCD